MLIPLLSACALFQAEHRLSDLNVPLNEIQHAVNDSLPLGRRKTSPNGREFYSNYFVPTRKGFRAAEKLTNRYYAHVYVLGDRRPYVVEVYVKREKQINDSSTGHTTYVEDGTDDRVAKFLVKKIQDELSKRREDRNVIDDFRVF